MPQLRNAFSGKRQRVLSLTDLPEPSFNAEWFGDDLGEPPHEMLAGLGFNSQEIEFLIAYEVEEYTLAELPKRLGCDPAEVERRRKRIDRKINAMRLERASKNQEFGTDLFGDV